MAKQPATPTASAPTPYPKGWAQMNQAQRREWMEKNGRRQTPAQQTAPAPKQLPTPIAMNASNEVEYPENFTPENEEQTASIGAALQGQQIHITIHFPGEEGQTYTGPELVGKLLRHLADGANPEAPPG